MDIDLLSKMVKELILDRDRVTLPGVGTFVAEMTPASFSDRGYTINPPYRRLFFRPQTGGDRSLIELYAFANNVDEDAAECILTDFLSEMKEVLKSRKLIVFPGLGRLRATRENNFFFVADENLDIYPEGFCLESISLKTHQETKEELSAAVEELKTMLVSDSVSKESVSVPVVKQVVRDEVDYEKCEAVGDVEEKSYVAESNRSAGDSGAEAKDSVEAEEEMVDEVDMVCTDKTSSEEPAVPEDDLVASSEMTVLEEPAVPEDDLVASSEMTVSEEPAVPEDDLVASSEMIVSEEPAVSEDDLVASSEMTVSEEPAVPEDDLAVSSEEAATEGMEEVVSLDVGVVADGEIKKGETDSGTKTEKMPGIGIRRKVLIWIASAVAVIVVFLVVYVLLTRLEPGLMDKLLYDAEQLEVLRYWK